MGVAGDLRYAVRMLTRTPAFTVPAIASLALGIAVNTTMFSVVNAVLLRPLTESGPATAVRIGRSMNNDRSFRSVADDEFDFLRRHASSFSDLVGHDIASLLMAGPDGPEFVSAEIVTRNYFRVLGRLPAIGRGFDEHAIADGAAVISEPMWRRRFRADPAVVGRDVRFNNQPFTVVGVAPAGFAGAFPGVATDVWLPSVRADAARLTDPRGLGSMAVIGILNSGVSPAAARAELQGLSRRLVEQDSRRDPARRLVMADTRGIHPGIAQRIRPIILAMMATVGVVLVIVCANVASLSLARASARRAEFAVRLALGAARRCVIAQLLVESFVLAVAGAAAGFALSRWAVGSINALTMIPGPTGAPAFLDLRLDRRVLTFTVVVTMLTTIAFGLIPALQGTRINLTSALRIRSRPPIAGGRECAARSSSSRSPSRWCSWSAPC